MPKNVIFDLDGTLVNTLPDLKITMSEFLATLSLPPVNEEEIKKCIGDGAKTAMQRLLVLKGYKSAHEQSIMHNLLSLKGYASSKNEEDELFASYMDIYNNLNPEKAVLFDGVLETLSFLKDMGCVMAVCTNKPKLPALNVLKRLGIIDFFTFIADADKFDVKKPNPKVLKELCNAIGEKEDNSIMVGDSSQDIECAKGAKITSVLVSYGFYQGNPSDLNPDFIINSMPELREIVKRA